MSLTFDLQNLELQETPKLEKILEPTQERFVLFPIQYRGLWKHYKHLESKFWTAEDIELSDDLDRFSGLPPKQQSIVTSLVSSLAIAQQDISSGIALACSKSIMAAEARCYFGFYSMQEGIHLELFGLSLAVLCSANPNVDSESLRDDSILLMSSLESFSKRQAFKLAHITDTNASYYYKITAYQIYCALFDSTIFDILFHLYDIGGECMIPGLVHGVAKIRHDRELMISFLNAVKETLSNHIDNSDVQRLVNQAVNVELSFISELREMSANNLTLGNKEIKFQDLENRILAKGDRLCIEFGSKPIFSVKDPLHWIDPLYESERSKYEEIEHIKEVAHDNVSRKNETISFTMDADF